MQRLEPEELCPHGWSVPHTLDDTPWIERAPTTPLCPGPAPEMPEGTGLRVALDLARRQAAAQEWKLD